jgi:hypothetical protein
VPRQNYNGRKIRLGGTFLTYGFPWRHDWAAGVRAAPAVRPTYRPFVPS